MVDDQDANNLVSIQEAFAMDDVTTDFLEQKQDEVDAAIGSRLEKSGKNQIPGWGDWGGPDTQKPLSRRALKRKRAKDRQDRLEAEQKVNKKRRDATVRWKSRMSANPGFHRILESHTSPVLTGF